MKKYLMIILALTLNQSFAFAKVTHGDFFDFTDENHKSPLYSMDVDYYIDGKIENAALTYRDSRQEIALVEKVKIDDDKIMQYVLHQKQTNSIYSLDVKGTDLFFSRKHGDTTTTRTLESKGELVAAPTLIKFLQNHWDEIAAARVVKGRFIVLERMETIPFDFKLMSEQPEEITIEMKPSQFLISLFLDPIFLTFSKSNRQLLKLKGRVVPKVKQNGSWKDWNAEVFYK